MKVISPTTKNKTIYSLLAEENLYPVLLEMGNPKSRIDQFQKKRVRESIIVGILMASCGFIISEWFYLFSVVIMFLFYKEKHKKIMRQYQVWKFQRHLQFSKFTRLLIPYLKESKGEVALYTIFNKLIQRMKEDADKNSLYKLMSQMSNNPNDIQPFIDYAERSSGTDMSVLFMSTIYDFQQSSSDTSVINELGKISSEELLENIDEIIKFKLNRFVYFPTKIVLPSIILVIGFAVAVVISSLSEFQL